ncbi:MAG: hypothetical protein KDA93_22855 [Planctomycetaceae bacterium]|nr:hypothetical protein [Planctomycetaceae bacterium]
MSQTLTATDNKDRMSHSRPDELQPSEDFVQYLKDYARAKPDVAALWCFGVGFVIGWKLKPW